jgi:hypothetical protein
LSELGVQQEVAEMALAGNAAIASKLHEMADVLDQQHAGSYRINAYRRAARSIEQHEGSVEDMVHSGGLKALTEIPGIGRGIGSAIIEMVTSGRWAQLERLSGTLEPELLFRTIPGIGPDLARRVHDDLHVDSLEALEVAAHDGRLEKIPGIGARRAAAIRASLGERLGARHLRASHHADAPPVELVLSVDREYRDKAATGALRTIAPKRFNPSGEAWLPVLHTQRGDWDFTALFSNTLKAHELHKTRDWVVIYFHLASEPEGQCTVVTETRGALAGRRVVRGREGETAAHYSNCEGNGAPPRSRQYD